MRFDHLGCGKSRKGSDPRKTPPRFAFFSRVDRNISRQGVWVSVATSYDARASSRVRFDSRRSRIRTPRALSSHPTRRRCPSSRPKSQWPAPDPARPLVVPGIRVSTSSRAYLRDAIGAASARPGFRARPRRRVRRKRHRRRVSQGPHGDGDVRRASRDGGAGGGERAVVRGGCVQQRGRVRSARRRL